MSTGDPLLDGKAGNGSALTGVPVNFSSGVTGTLSAANGGTGSTTLSGAVNAMGLAGVSNYGINSVGIAGQIWVSSGSGRGGWVVAPSAPGAAAQTLLLSSATDGNLVYSDIKMDAKLFLSGDQTMLTLRRDGQVSWPASTPRGSDLLVRARTADSSHPSTYTSLYLEGKVSTGYAGYDTVYGNGLYHMEIEHKVHPTITASHEFSELWFEAHRPANQGTGGVPFLRMHLDGIGESPWGAIIKTHHEATNPYIKFQAWDGSAYQEALHIDKNGLDVTGTLTVNGSPVSGGMTYPGAGLAVSTGSAWTTSLSSTSPTFSSVTASSLNGSAVNTNLINHTDVLYFKYGGVIKHGFNTNGNAEHKGNLTVVGSITKGSGGFRITHPLDEDKWLYHSFIEGPQADLIYRGKAVLEDGSASVSIDDAAGMTSGTFVELTQDIQVFVQNTSGWTPVRGQVVGGILTIEAQTSCDDEVGWLVIAERADSFVKDWDLTDEDGHLITELVKEEEEV